MFKWLLLLLVASCGSQNKEHTVQHDQLSNKFNLYRSMATGAPTHFGCDSTLFDGLLGSVPGLNVDLTAARNEDGTWNRNPKIDCYGEGLSRSSFSRDMFLGVLWWSVANKRVDVLEDIYNYCSKQAQFPIAGCVFGKGPLDDPRHVLSPNLIDTLAESIVYLGGTNHVLARGLYSGETEDLEGFQAHLSVLHILLRGKVQEGISNRQLSILKYHAERQPDNALFTAAYHKYSGEMRERAVASLMDESRFPSDRLPSTSEYCAEWLWQRDFSTEKDWTPCPENAKIHSGGDWLFAAALLLGYL